LTAKIEVSLEMVDKCIDWEANPVTYPVNYKERQSCSLQCRDWLLNILCIHILLW